jgi:serine/threonine-protein kinase HipA
VTVALSDNKKKCLSGFNQLPTGFTHWLVKFRSKEDPQDMGCIEMAYADMARIAGLDMPECRLLRVESSEQIEEYFAVRRFDRDGATRFHWLSLAGYVYADYRLPSIGYDTVIKATRKITGSIAEAEKAYRLMAFNVLTHNKDDHAKNFAFLHLPQGWMLSPAYDLTFSTGINNQHTTDIAGSGNPELSDLKRLAQDCGIRQWQAIVEQVSTATMQWSVVAKQRGVSVKNIKRIANEFEKISLRIF